MGRKKKSETFQTSQTGQPPRIPVAVIGATGYTGVELIRLLLQHPFVDLVSVTSHTQAHQRIADLFPVFAGATELVLEKLNIYRIGRQCNVVFLCLPHHQSMETAARFRKLGVKVIDLSADFRFQHVRTYERIYGRHTQRALLRKAAYGLPEIFGQAIKDSCLVGVPGCYVTSIVLGLAPLLQNQMILTEDIVCDAKSGTSGAGRSSSVDKILAEVHGNFKAYGLTNHRHRPEIEERLTMLAGQKVTVTFTPHLIPIARGILSTIYVKPLRKLRDDHLIRIYQKFYRKSPFIKILERGQTPQIKSVVGTNNCHISLNFDSHTERLIIVTSLDNLVKGASGQALQCLNLMCGFEETTGLTQVGVWP